MEPAGTAGDAGTFTKDTKPASLGSVILSSLLQKLFLKSDFYFVCVLLACAQVHLCCAMPAEVRTLDFGGIRVKDGC